MTAERTAETMTFEPGDELYCADRVGTLWYSRSVSRPDDGGYWLGEQAPSSGYLPAVGSRQWNDVLYENLGRWRVLSDDGNGAVILERLA